MAATSEENFSLENICCVLANDLILSFDLPLIRVVHLKQIRSPFLIYLYSSIIGLVPPGVSLHPKSDEEERLNIKTIVRLLESDLEQSIDPTKVLQGDVDSIYALLSLFLNKARNGVRMRDVAEQGSVLAPEEKKDESRKNSDVGGDNNKPISNDGGRRLSFIQFVNKELSELDVSSATKRQLMKKYEQYISFEAKMVSNSQKRKKIKSQIAFEESRTRQTSLTKLLSKEMEIGRRLETIRAERRERLAEKGRVRDKRIRLARLNRLHNDAEASRRAKQSQSKHRKEVILKNICDENLTMRKTRLLIRLKSEQEEIKTESAKAELTCEATMKFYEDQVLMMADEMKTERTALLVREQAQSKLVDNLKRVHNEERTRNLKWRKDQTKQKRERAAQLQEDEAQRLKEDLWKMQ